MNLEELADAARAAVEQFEASSIDDEEEEDEEDFIFDDEYDDRTIPELEVEEFEEVEDEEMDFEALGRAAREAVKKMETIAQKEQAPAQNWSKLKVVELKAELKSRGLPTTGRKADLVAALEEADQATASEEDLFELHDPDLDAEEPDFEELAQAAREAAALYNPDLMEDAQEMEEEEIATTEMDLESMTILQLKAELKARGLKVSGRKAELIERLRGSS